MRQQFLHVWEMCKENGSFFTHRGRHKSIGTLLHKGRALLKAGYIIPDLPPPGVEEAPAVLRALAQAHRPFAELKARAASIPNQDIQTDTLAFHEAKARWAIENISPCRMHRALFGQVEHSVARRLGDPAGRRSTTIDQDPVGVE